MPRCYDGVGTTHHRGDGGHDHAPFRTYCSPPRGVSLRVHHADLDQGRPPPLGMILARGRRTVTAALRPMGLDDDAGFSKDHHVFNRAVWSPLRLACTLTCLWVRTVFRSDPRLTFVIDETLERRWGQHRIRGHYRDPLASSTERSVAASGIRWIVLALVVTPPWSTTPWALPVLSRPSPTPTVSAQLGRRHQTIVDGRGKRILGVRRGLPKAELTVVGDSTSSSVIDLGLCCQWHGVRDRVVAF